MNAGIFSDLDGTLVFSSRHLDSAADRVLVEYLHGKPQAWMTENSWRSIHDVRQNAHFVPVTTRTRDQYLRINLPGGEPEYAIVANGGRIFHNGQTDTEWEAAVEDSSWGFSRVGAVVDTLRRHLDGQPWVGKVGSHDSIVYIVTRRGETAPEKLFSLANQVAADNGYTAHPQGRKTHLIPSHVTKEAAAAEVADRLGVTRTIASGDHQLDAGLMLWADEAIQPAHGVAVPGIPITGAAGVRASEEIARAFLKFAAAGE